MKVVVYTAVSRGYDNLKPVHTLWRKEAAFVAFVECQEPALGWQYRPLYRRFRDPCRNAKIHKVLPHRYFPEVDYSLWVDGSVAFKSRVLLKQLIETYLRQHDLAVFRHRNRDCCYQEALACLLMRRDSPAVIDRQMKKYHAHGYPPHRGLAECTILLRRHTAEMARFNECWHAEIRKHSRRDQLSFNYVADKLGLRYRTLPGNMDDNPHFTWHAHAPAALAVGRAF